MIPFPALRYAWDHGHCLLRKSHLPHCSREIILSVHPLLSATHLSRLSFASIYIVMHMQYLVQHKYTSGLYADSEYTSLNNEYKS